MKNSFVPIISTTPIEEKDKTEMPEIFPPRIEKCSYDFIDQLSELVDGLKPNCKADIAVKQSLKDWIEKEGERHLDNLFKSL